MNVTVFATADHTKNVTTAVTVSSYTSVLNGTYVLQVIGSDGNPYQTTGTFVFDGNGNITSGEQTINSSSSGFFSSLYTVQDASVAPSTYFIGPDGRGTITLNVQSSLTANAETLAFVVLSASKALVTELDGASASGTLELQDSTAATTMPTGAYAFVTSGSDTGVVASPVTGSAPSPTAIGGVFNIDNNPSPGSISGNGSLADQDYFNTKGTKAQLQSCAPPTGVTGSVSQPDSFGAVTIVLTGATCFGLTQPGTIQFTGYIVDATHIRLIESDDVDGTTGFLTAGIAVSQGSAAGTFTNASLTGPYIFAVLGYDEFAGSSGSFTSATSFTADGNGNVTGITDTLYPGSFTAYTSTALTGTYTMDATLVGRALLIPKFKGSPHPKPNVLLYMTGNGTPPLLLWSEGPDVNFPAIGVGSAYPQAANASTLTFGSTEKYGFRFTQNLGSEVDGSGDDTSVAGGVSGTLTGTDDDYNNNIFGGGTPLSLLDTFTLPADSFGRIAGTFQNSAGNAGPYVEYYMVDDNNSWMVETDLLNTGQVTLGYFTQACDVTNPTSCQATGKKGALSPLRRPGSHSLRRSPRIPLR